MLCCDYKLISKVLSVRLKNTLPFLINSSQTGFVTGRYIGENINTILQIIETTENEDIPGVIMSADFAKAFDNLDWGYLNSVLEYFKFGPIFQNWIKLLNSNVSAVTIRQWLVHLIY